MSVASDAIATEAVAADPAPYSTGVGELAAFGGFGTQSEIQFRGERFTASETRWRFVARESDGEEMIGVTDKDPNERVWYELDFSDILRGASISSIVLSATPGLSVLAYQLASNGQVTGIVRLLAAGGGPPGNSFNLTVTATCSDTSVRRRTLKIRSKSL